MHICTSFFEAKKKKSLTYLLLCDNFLSPSNQTFKISGVIYEATDHPLKERQRITLTKRQLVFGQLVFRHLVIQKLVIC